MAAVEADHEDTVVGIRRPATPEPAAVDTDDTVLRDPAFDGSAHGLPDPSVAVAERAELLVRVGGDEVALDAAVYVGRRPSPPRIAEPVPPTLVTVPSPRSEVSRTHARIRRVGDCVVVTDLRSANGTTVIVPNGPARTLRQGESMVVPPGSAIDLGDGNLVAVEQREARS